MWRRKPAHVYLFASIWLVSLLVTKATSSIFRLRATLLCPNLHCKDIKYTQIQSFRKNSFLLIRGGSDFDSDFESDAGFSDVDDDLFGLDDSVDLEDDFSEQNTLSLAVQAFQKSPPVTKLFLTSSFFCSLLGYLQNKNDFPSYFLLDWKATLTKFQFWRPVTAFLNFGPLSLGWFMTAHFVWTYMATLERLNHNQPYEFWYMIFFGCTTMVMGYTFLNISPRFLGHNLSTFLVYIWSRYHEGLEVNMFEMFNTRAEMLPWFFLAQTFLLEGEFPILDLLGIVFGHVYHYLRSVGGIGRCPQFVRSEERRVGKKCPM
jgi:Derlin-2/3